MPGGIRLSWGHLTLICLAAVVFFIAYWNFIPHSDDVNLDKKDGKGQDGRINTKLPKKLDKIDTGGQYIPFYGYTVICELVDRAKYTEISDYIRNSKTLGKYFSPLPASSYHVTMFDVLTQRKMPSRYIPESGTVPSYHWFKALENLKADLSEAQKSCDLFKGAIVFKKDKFSVGTSGLSVHGTVTNMEEVSKLRSAITAIFQKNDDPRTFHIGLAYKFRAIEDGDIDSVSKELDNLWKLIKDEYVLHGPNVYYFETMEKFIPFKSLNF